MNQQSKPRLTIWSFFLDELIIGCGATELRWKVMLQYADDICVEECHAAGSELLKALDPVQMRLPAESLEWAATMSCSHCRLIAH